MFFLWWKPVVEVDTDIPQPNGWLQGIPAAILANDSLARGDLWENFDEKNLPGKRSHGTHHSFTRSSENHHLLKSAGFFGIGDMWSFPFWVYPEIPKDNYIWLFTPRKGPIILLRIFDKSRRQLLLQSWAFKGIQVYIANMMVWKKIIFNGMFFLKNVGFPGEYRLIFWKDVKRIFKK